jgi:hypothetical protein
MQLYRTWGDGGPAAVPVEVSPEERKLTHSRWRRAWVLAQSRKAVRKWVQERDAGSK